MHGKSITPTALRRELFSLLDRVVETHQPLEVERRGRILVITEKSPRPSALRRYLAASARNAQRGSDEELMTPDWGWDEERNLA